MDVGDGPEVWVSMTDMITYLRFFAEGLDPKVEDLETLEHLIGLGASKIIDGLANELDITTFRATLDRDDLFGPQGTDDPRSDS